MKDNRTNKEMHQADYMKDNRTKKEIHLNLKITNRMFMLIDTIRSHYLIENERLPSRKVKHIAITDEPSQERKTEEAVNTFNKFYRRLDPDTRFFFLEWLRIQLIKRLTNQEIMTLTSEVTSASKGNSEPKNPNRK